MTKSISIGEKFNRLTVIGIGRKEKFRQYYIAQCECGSPPKEIWEWNLKHGGVKSCGCLRSEVSKMNRRNMGLSRRKHFGCSVCGSDKHYAKGLCRLCYNKMRRGTLEGFN